MDQREFTIEAIQEARDAYQGQEDARYLFVSLDLYKSAIDLCILKSKINLCPMVLDAVAGKVWGVSCEDDPRTIGEMFDAETAEERSERIVRDEQPPTVRKVEKVRPAPSRRWGKSMTARQVAAVDEHVGFPV